MPFYDVGCEACDWREIDVLEPVHRDPRPCPMCSAPTVRMWTTKPPTAIGDEMHHWQVNGLAQPRLFESKIEHRRWMKENRYQNATRHVGEQGSDKSKHTTNWASRMDPYTAESVRILIERTYTEGRAVEDSLPPLKAKVYTGELDSPEYREFTRGR